MRTKRNIGGLLRRPLPAPKKQDRPGYRRVTFHKAGRVVVFTITPVEEYAWGFQKYYFGDPIGQPREDISGRKMFSTFNSALGWMDRVRESYLKIGYRVVAEEEDVGAFET